MGKREGLLPWPVNCSLDLIAIFKFQMFWTGGIVSMAPDSRVVRKVFLALYKIFKLVCRGTLILIMTNCLGTRVKVGGLVSIDEQLE